MELEFALLNYGSHSIKVQPSETHPLPMEFDFDKAEECARKIFAVMSNASGGFTLSNCKVRMHRGRKFANLTCNGSHIYYRDQNAAKLSIDEAMKVHEESEVIELGAVSSDQYGDGWKRAQWSNP